MDVTTHVSKDFKINRREAKRSKEESWETARDYNTAREKKEGIYKDNKEMKRVLK